MLHALSPKTFLKNFQVSAKNQRMKPDNKIETESLSPMIRKTLEEYIYSLGMALGESSFRTEPLTYKFDRAHENLFEKRKDCLIIENKLVRGVCNDLFMRFRKLVTKIFFEIMQRLLPWPRKFQFFEQSIL